MPTTIEDRLVVGDESVVVDLYREHGAFIHTISQELVGAAADRLTQQVFVEAWRDRLEFNPSLGTVRSWLVRRTRERVAGSSPGSDSAVDRMVVADSLARMDDVRRRVLLAGVEASDVEGLARELDLPAATVRGHLRRGMELLHGDLAESRADGSASSLGDIVAERPEPLQEVAAPEVVWQAVAAEIGLDPRLLYEDSNGVANAGAVSEADSDGEDVATEGEAIAQGSSSGSAGGAGQGTDRGLSAADGPVTLPSGAASSESERPSWLIPAVLAVILVVLLIVALAL